MIRKIARPMLASVFILDGVDTLRKTSEHVEPTEELLQQLRSVLPADIADSLPRDPKAVARALGATKVGAGSLLAIGKMPRVAAFTLAAATLPTLMTRDAFWDADESDERRARVNNFVTTSALLGGLFITTQDTEGKPGLKWRAEHVTQRGKKKLDKALPTQSESEKMLDNARDKASDFSAKAEDFVKDTSDKARTYVDDNKDDWSKTAHQWLDSARDNAKTAKKSAVKAAQKAQDRANEALENAEGTTGRRAKKAAKRAEKFQDQADKSIAKAMKKLDKKIHR